MGKKLSWRKGYVWGEKVFVLGPADAQNPGEGVIQRESFKVCSTEAVGKGVYQDWVTGEGIPEGHFVQGRGVCGGSDSGIKSRKVANPEVHRQTDTQRDDITNRLHIASFAYRRAEV